MVRMLVRAVGLLLLATAFAAAVMDGTRSLANQQVSLTSMGVALGGLFPARMSSLPALVAKINPLLWDPILLSILYVPAFIDLAVVGLVFIAFSRPGGGRDRRGGP